MKTNFLLLEQARIFFFLSLENFIFSIKDARKEILILKGSFKYDNVNQKFFFEAVAGDINLNVFCKNDLDYQKK